MIVLGLAALLASAGPLDTELDAELDAGLDGLRRVDAGPVPLRSGKLSRRTITLHGLPVRGGYEIVDPAAPDGSSRVVAARVPAVAPRRRPSEAALSADSIRAWLAQRGHDPSTLAAEPRLVYRLVLDTPVLAWEVKLPFEMSPDPHLRTLWIGAMQGRLLGEYDAVFGSRAQVFIENPVVMPEPVEVTLHTLDVTEPGRPLSSESFEIWGCGDGPADPDAPTWEGYVECAPRQLARSDDDGDYFVPLPDIGLVADNETIDDPYAEVAAYYHAEHFFSVMDARGLASRRCDRFTVAVNVHSYDGDGQFQGYSGASYLDQCDPEVAPQLLVGQGRYADFAYDSGVINHELGHSVIQDLTPGGLVERRYALHGVLSEAGAVNEGLADYLSMTVSGDPLMGEYIGRFHVSSGTPYIRSGLSQAQCPRDLISDWHSDGRVVSSAMWAIRTRLGPEQTDTLLLRTLPRLPPDAVLDDFGSILLEVAQQARDAGEIDDTQTELVRRILDGRGLLDCLHVIDDEGLATTGKRMVLVAAGDEIQPYAPGPIQLRYEVPADAREITLWVTIAGGEPEERAVSMLLSRDGEPVEFQYETRPATADEDADEVIMVSGSHTLEVEAEWLNGEDFIARVPVEPGEVLHVALANRTPESVRAANFFVVASEPTIDADADADEPEGEPDGCGCRGAGGRGGAWALCGLLLAWRRRGSW